MACISVVIVQHYDLLTTMSFPKFGKIHVSVFEIIETCIFVISNVTTDFRFPKAGNILADNLIECVAFPVNEETNT